MNKSRCQLWFVYKQTQMNFYSYILVLEVCKKKQRSSSVVVEIYLEELGSRMDKQLYTSLQVERLLCSFSFVMYQPASLVQISAAQHCQEKIEANRTLVFYSREGRDDTRCILYSLPTYLSLSHLTRSPRTRNKSFLFSLFFSSALSLSFSPSKSHFLCSQLKYLKKDTDKRKRKKLFFVLFYTEIDLKYFSLAFL